MGFWRWYLGLLSVRGLFKRSLSADNEFAAGVVIAVAGVIIAPLGVVIGNSDWLGLLWFCILFPVGVTIAAHGYWRKFRKGDR